MKKFYLLLWLVGIAQFSQAQNLQADSIALVALYNSTNGASWTNNTNWLQPTGIGNWYGVTVSGNRVTQLALSDNNVVGTLPASIGNLTALTSLQIRGNQVVGLSGPIPTSIGNLTNLTFLDLARNFLVGPIPAQLGNLTNLQYLALDANPFGGTFPTPVLSLNSLTVLSMAGCQLTGSIPAQIGNLNNLASFNVIANQLSGSLPTELGTLSNLYQLYLNNNQFTGPLPASLNNLNLQYAWFDSNSFTGTAPAFTGSTGTMNLRLNNNQFQDLPNLTTHSFSTLSLQNNRFTFEDLQPNAGIPLVSYIPQAKVPVPDPNPVVLAGNPYTFIAPIGGTGNVYQWYKNSVAIGGATQATYLIASVTASNQGSYFVRATNPMVGGLTIESDPILLTVPTPPANVQDSTALVAFYNAMNGPGWTNKTNWLVGKVSTWYGVTMDGSGRVSGLSLPNNQVRGTFPPSFMTLAGLQTLTLTSNTFGIILPVNLNQLTALTTLNLNNCGQTGLPPLSGLVNLTLLNVTSNSLTFEDLEPIASIPGIVYNPQNNFGLGGAANIVPGNPWSATANAGGSANQYQWYKAAVPVGGATTNSISIPAVSAGDAGSYQLRVTSPLVPGITLISAANLLTVVSPGPQTYFTWPSADGIINDTPSDSYGGYWADIDNDGDDDLAIANLQSASTGRAVDLYENNGGVFTRLLSAGMPTTDSPRNISWVDFDNDGDLDFYVGDVGFNLSDAKGAFYRNNGDKTFTRLELDQLADGGMWADYDNDGLVDLFIVDSGQPTTVYRNQGNGTFTLSPISFALGSDWTLAFADMDNDRDLDFVQIGKAPNTGFNNLQRNDSAGFYSYQSSSIISTDNLFSARGGSWADIDNDGDMDFFAMNSNTGGTVESAFYINDGSGNFTKVLASARLGADVRGRSSAFGDLDNDGDLDFAVHNGRAGNTGLIVFLNNGSGTFAQISLASQTFIPVTSVTLAQMSLGDANSDGFLDIFSANFNASQPPSLYRNVGNSNHWIKFRLQGTVSNRSGVGARIEIKTGGNKQIREVTTQTGLAAQNSLVQHFGIAGAPQVDTVKVYWPSGLTTTLTNIAPNQLLTVAEVSPEPPINQADSLALVNFYNGTNGPGWTNKTNWLVGNANTWYGVTVSGGRVTQLNLPTNNLTGSLPNLSALTALTRFDVPNNLIGGGIPTTLNTLTSLQHLNLRNNRFTGTVPNLGALTNLKYFSIGLNNFLTFGQPIPAFVTGLTQLEYLGLDNNRLSGVIPTGFSNLIHLKELTMATLSSGTPSNEFIAELATIQTLERITLVNLNLGGFLINLAPLGGLNNLEFLDLRSTNLASLPAANVWMSDSLTIDISSNALDFGDLEPLQGITQPTFVNTGQALLLFSAINPGTVTLVEGDPFSLQTFFGGTQNNYVWQKGGVPIPGQTGTTLDLDSIEASEAGVYRLQMTNNIVTGLTLTTTNITLNVTPRVQSRFAIQQNSILTQEIGASSYGGYWADIDRDGDEDLFVNNAFDTNPNFLYQNNADGTFTKVTTGDITTLRDPSRYASWGDYDNNGYLDMFVGDYTNGDDISSLYQNNGNGTFNRIPFNHKSDGGLWADYDNDGDLDLSVMVTSALPVSNKLYKNNGGTFEVIENFVPFTSTWVAGWVDMDNDGDLDYFLTDANLNPSNIRLFRNDQGVFTASTVPLPTGNFSVRALSWADIDGDGDQDFFAENINGNITSTAESQFYINDGTGQFTRENASLRTGGLRLAGARGTVFGDADNDGDLDLFVNHKHLTTSNDVIVQLLLNNGSGSFTVVPIAEQSFGVSDFGTNMSMADYNNDGFLDLFIANFDILIPNRLCRNLQSANGNHWIKLNLEGTVSNRSAIGTRVDIYSGGNRSTRQVLSSSGLSGQNSLLVHSGLGSATQADSVVIYWPSGNEQRFYNLAADQTIAIEEGTTSTEQNSSNIVFSNVTTSSMHVAFTPGSGTSRLVIARRWSAANFQPSDSTTYTLGQQLDSSRFVMYLGDSSHFDATVLQPDTDYFLEFFEINYVGGYPKYKKPGATATQKTLPAMMWGSLGSGPGQFYSPFDVAVGPDGTVVVVDPNNQRIQKFTSGGGFLWEKPIDQPFGAWVDKAGGVYVTSRWKVQKFDASGNFLFEFGTIGSGPGQFEWAFDVVTDNDSNIYVVGTPFRIEKYNSSGQYLLTHYVLPSPGERLDIDESGNIYVTMYNAPQRIIKLNPAGDVVQDNQAVPSQIYAVAVDTYGFVYASPTGASDIYEYNTTGSHLHTFNTGGSSQYGLADNANGTRLYVAETSNHRIRVIDITKLDQIITFDSIGPIQELSVPYPLNATALGGVPVQFSSSNDSIASISGNQLTFHQPGTVTISAFTLGTHEYKPGMSAQMVSMLRQVQSITSTPIPFKSVGEAPFALQATSTSGLPVQFTSSDSTVATITNNMVWVWGAGTTTITMNQSGNSNFLAAPETSQTLTVYPAGDLRNTLITTTHLGGAQNHGAIISVDNDGGNYQLLHVFDSIQGQRPTGQLLQVGEFLYGTASGGGDFDAGTIYRIKPDGSEFQTLHMFNSANGKEPFGGLMQASDGDLYGATASGGTANFGTIYKISPDGSGFTKLHDFVEEEEGYNPYGKLVQATNGYLYGTTVGGGENSFGTIFWIRTNGNDFDVLHSFQETGGTSPYGGLYQAANGKLYGGAYGGGDNGLWTGALFSIELDGSEYTKLYDFGAGENGRNPFYGGVLTQGRDGSLFGTANSGGDFGGGTVFKLTHDSTLVNLRDFVSSPVGSVVIGPDEKLYGLTLYGGGNGLGTLFKLGQDGSSVENILEMTSETGSYPFVTSPTLVYSAKLTQTITFDALPEKALGDTPFALTATASSGLPVSYTSSNPSVAYIQSDTVFIVAAGSTIITARQPGNSVYSASDSVSHLLTVIDNTIRPTVPSTNLVFTNVFSTQMNVSFSPGNGERHLVAMRAGAPVTWVPTDGSHYAGSFDFASASDPGDGTKIISVDSSTSIAVTGLPPSTVIHVRVFEFNGDDYTKYLVSSTLIGSRTTLALPNVFVATPANNAVNQNVTLNVTSSNLAGATTFTIELDTVPYFAAPMVRSGARTQNFSGLSYGKLYYSRVKTNLSPDYGPVRSFSTAPAEFFSYVTSPANNATGVTLNSLARSVTMNNVIGAVTYTCELNTSSLFDGISQVKTGGRTQTFTGLSTGTTYYSRVRTDLSPNTWGPTRQFTTVGASLLTWVSSPANNAVNVSYQPNVTVTDVGATSYQVQLSPASDFTVNVLQQTSPTRTMSFTGLAYNTQYYSRARTELDSAWGPLRSFTTNSPLTYSYMTSPANNAVNVNYVVNITANTVPGATTYFIEANTMADFSGTSIVRSGARTQNFTLTPNQQYYVRVSTDLLPGQYGAVRSFTTISSLAYSYITSPANGATNVPYVTNVTAYNVPLATSFIIEANTLPDFSGTSIVKMGTVRTYSFTLAHDQVYYVRVQTNLAPGEWGQSRSFTTGSPQSLAYVTSPANGVVGVPTTVNVTSNLVPGATSYTIELNPEEFFTGTPIIRTGAGRTKNFTGLSENRTYYSRVSTSLTPGVWGPTRSFTTVNPGGRQAGEAWVESTDEDPLVPDEITEVTIFPNPFTDQFDIHVQTTVQQPLEAQLLDMNGRKVFEARDWMTNRLHTVKGEFSPGIYLLELNTEGTRRVVRVVRR